jgi:hypothetical protein
MRIAPRQPAGSAIGCAARTGRRARVRSGVGTPRNGIADFMYARIGSAFAGSATARSAVLIPSTSPSSPTLGDGIGQDRASRWARPARV